MTIDDLKSLRLLNRADIAKLLGCHTRTVDRLRKQPGFPAPVKLAEKADPRWRMQDVAEYLKSL
jgi:predicted DNA-binding transcriptional regulator AlpA